MSTAKRGDCTVSHSNPKRRRNPYAGLLPGFKRCTTCDVVLPASSAHFHSNKTTRDGFHGTCKECAKARTQKWYKENKERARESNKRYRATNRDTIREQHAIWREAHKEYTARKSREWRKDNPDAATRKTKEWRKRNRSRVRERTRLYNTQRRARLKGLPDNYNLDDWKQTLEYWGQQCAACSGTDNLHADHWIPINSPECPGTIKTNMVPLCERCNKSKAAKPPQDWLRESYGIEFGKVILDSVENYFNNLS